MPPTETVEREVEASASTLNSAPVSPIKRLALQLLRLDEVSQTMPSSCTFLDDLNEFAEETSIKMEGRAFSFLGYEIDDAKYTREQVKGVIDALPGALLYKGKMAVNATADAMYTDTLSFVPLLAVAQTQRASTCIEYERRRGGVFHRLLVAAKKTDPEERSDDMPINMNAHNNIQNNTPQNIDFDAKVVGAFKELKSLGLFRKEDVQEYELHYYSLDRRSPKTFEFMMEMDPQALLNGTNPLGEPLMHGVVNIMLQFPLSKFEMLLKAIMKYYPHEVLRLLFEKFDHLDKTKTACEVIFEKCDQDQAMNIIHKYIPPHYNYPILHHVIQHAPQYMDIFTYYYPESAYVKDTNGRSLFLSSLASGHKNFRNDPLFFLRATNGEIATMDPVTELYPFALLAASGGDTSDLAGVYKLLRRDPSLVLGGKSRCTKHANSNGDNSISASTR